MLKSQRMQEVTERCNYHSVEDMLAALGYGEITLKLILNRLRELTVKTEEPETISPPSIPEKTSSSPSPSSSKSPIAGIEGLVYYIAGCCNPIPGESIIGAVAGAGKGIAIHRQGCPNVEKIEGSRLIPVHWNSAENNRRPNTYPIDLQIEAIDRVGVFKDILSRLSDSW